MSLSSEPLLTGKKVRLAAIQMEDAKLIAEMDGDSYFSRRLSTSAFRPANEGQIREQLKEWINDKQGFPFAIRTIPGDTFIGTIGLFGILWNHRAAWLAIGIGDPDARGKGYGREAMTLLIDYGFRELNLHRIQLIVFSYNEPAIALYEKLGFVYEGRMRETLHRDGQRHDTLLYGLLRHEWEGKS